jgi:hypothetical protein
VAETVRYAKRFGLVYLLLAVVVGVAAGTTINFVRDGSHSGSPWSDWKPTAPPELRPKEIASRVAAAYRTAGGRPLVDVVTGDPFQSVITEVATPAVGAGFGRDTPVYDPSRMRMFILCGQGKNCSVPGTPSVERTLLLHREAVELALYTFKYVDTDGVVEFLPGTTTARPNLAFFFRRSEVEPFLSQPLRSTLPRTPQSRSAERVDRLALTHMYRFELQQAQAGGGLLVLDRG